METNYISRDTYGMYKNVGPGPGPALMGADTLIGNDVYNTANESLGTIKELMIDMSSGKISYAVLSYGGFLGMGRSTVRGSVDCAKTGYREQALYAQCHEGTA